MKLFEDIRIPWLIHVKAALFVLLGVVSSAMLFLEMPTVRTVALLSIAIWSFCRFYYYLFYVLDRFLGRDKRFSSVFDALLFLLFPKRRREAPPAGAEKAAKE